jgi:hypothetical protein
VYVLDVKPDEPTDYYAIDVATWMFPFTVADVRRLIDSRLASGYGVECARGLTVVLARGANGRRVDPALRRVLDSS